MPAILVGGTTVLLLLIVIAIRAVVMMMTMGVMVRRLRRGPAMGLTAACVVTRRMLPQMHATTTHHLGDVERQNGNGNHLPGHAHSTANSEDGHDLQVPNQS